MVGYIFSSTLYGVFFLGMCCRSIDVLMVCSLYVHQAGLPIWVQTEHLVFLCFGKVCKRSIHKERYRWGYLLLGV